MTFEFMYFYPETVVEAQLLLMMVSPGHIPEAASWELAYAVPHG